MVPKLSCQNPHELMRAHEVLDILTVAKMVLYASLARKSSSAPLCFTRSDYPEMDPEKDRCLLYTSGPSGVHPHRKGKGSFTEAHHLEACPS